MTDQIYFDNAATTQIDPIVLEDINTKLRLFYGNPSSIHKLGQQSRNIIETSRELIANYFNSHSSRIFFSSSATESINTILKGFFLAKPKHLKARLITSKLEHSATIEVAKWLEANNIAKVIYVDHDENGVLNMDHFHSTLMSNEHTLISIMHVNNEIGNINPIKEISCLAKKYKAYFHCDCTQSLGKVEFESDFFDFFSTSIHKIHGPKGVGIFYCKEPSLVEPLICGGGQENLLRSGTENLAYISGFATALNIIQDKRHQNLVYIDLLSKQFITSLKQHGVDFNINGDQKNKLSSILNITFKTIQGKFEEETFLTAIIQEGIFISNSSACSSGVEKTSRVLRELGFSKSKALKTVRFSFSKFNSMEEIIYAAAKVSNVVRRLS